MDLSLIIPMRQETFPKDLCAHIQSSRYQSEVILVDTSDVPLPINAWVGLSHIQYHWRPKIRTRAEAMNFGAEQARGEYLLFLHADVMFTANVETVLYEAMGNRITWGTFEKTYVPSSTLLGLQARLLNVALRRWGSLWVGSNGLWAHKEAWKRLGGFPPQAFLEDVTFYKHLTKTTRPRVFATTLAVSARRYQQSGQTTQQFRNALIYFLYQVGVPWQVLAGFY